MGAVIATDPEGVISFRGGNINSLALSRNLPVITVGNVTVTAASGTAAPEPGFGDAAGSRDPLVGGGARSTFAAARFRIARRSFSYVWQCDLRPPPQGVKTCPFKVVLTCETAAAGSLSPLS